MVENLAYSKRIDLGNNSLAVAQGLAAATGTPYTRVTLMTARETITADTIAVDDDVYILTNASRIQISARQPGTQTKNLVDVVGTDRVIAGFLDR